MAFPPRRPLFAVVITSYSIHYTKLYEAFKRGSHLKLIFLNRYVGEKFSRLFWLFGRVLAVGVFSLLIYHGLLQAKVERELGIISEALSVPQWGRNNFV